jgi:uncharacterized protein
MCPILIVPGYTGSGPEHWQSLWEKAMPHTRRVEQRAWAAPDRTEWVAALGRAITSTEAPPVLIAHSLGCLTVAHWASERRSAIAGALLVAPPDVERLDTPDVLRSFSPIPLSPLAFPSIVVASTDDPYVSVQRSATFARAWGCRFVTIGAAGHINTASGFGPWPEGELLLRQLMP